MSVVASQKAILLVEDNEDDVFFVRHALQKAGIENPFHVVEDGGVAMDYLAGRGKYEDRAAFPLPSFVILDLKLPRVWGLDVLKWIRAQPELRSLPVVVFTGSDDSLDAQRAYGLGANSYFIKPADFDAVANLIASLCTFWLKWNRLPSSADA